MSSSIATRRRTRNVWAVAPEDTVGDSTRFAEFVGFFVLTVPGVAVPGLGVPLNELGAALVVLFAITRPAEPLRFRLWWVVGLGSILGWLVVTSYLNDLTPYRRLLHVALYASLALLMAGGRVHIPSAVRGLTIGLLVSTTFSLAGIGPNLDYAGRLNGVLGDPNLAGYVLTVLGCLAIGSLAPGRLRTVLMAVVGLGVVLTFSRTALLAAVLAVAWVLLHRRVGFFRGAVLLGFFVLLVRYVPDRLRLVGPFADREGSDALRQRLVDREHLDVDRHPIIGSGAGTARVRLGPSEFFYHSSYLAMQREGGLVLLVIFLVVIISVFIALVRLPGSSRNGWYEAAFIALLVIAVNLGEVLLELPAAVVFGFGAWHAFRAPPEESPLAKVVAGPTRAPTGAKPPLSPRPRPGPRPDSRRRPPAPRPAS